MGLPEQQPASPAEPDQPSPLSNLRRAAARCWALLLVRIYECLPLRCPKCGEPMRIIGFVLDRPTVERIVDHIGEPTQPPRVQPARSPPQLAFGFDQTPATTGWPETDQTAGTDDGCDAIGVGRIDGWVGVVGQSCGAGGPRSGEMVVDYPPCEPIDKPLFARIIAGVTDESTAKRPLG